MSDLAVRLRDGTHAETQAHQLIYQLIEKVADLALREVIPRAQHAHKGQRPGSELTLGHAGRQQPCMRLAAACTAAAVEAVFADLRAHRRDLEDLMALRLEGQLDLAATFTNRLGLAVHKAAYLGFVEHGPLWSLCPGGAPRLGSLARRCTRLSLPGPFEDGGLEALLESRLTRSSSRFTRSINRAITAWHSGTVCGSCASPASAGSTGTTLVGLTCTGKAPSRAFVHARLACSRPAAPIAKVEPSLEPRQ